MNKYQTLASNTALISIGTFGSKLLVFLMVRFCTGYLTPADYGIADLLTQTANLLIPVFSAGFYMVTLGSVLIWWGDVHLRNRRCLWCWIVCLRHSQCLK